MRNTPDMNSVGLQQWNRWIGFPSDLTCTPVILTVVYDILINSCNVGQLKKKSDGMYPPHDFFSNFLLPLFKNMGTRLHLERLTIQASMIKHHPIMTNTTIENQINTPVANCVLNFNSDHQSVGNLFMCNNIR